MLGGLTAGYGTCAAYAGRYLYPANPSPRVWQFLVEVDRLRAGDSIHYQAPDGQRIAVARQAETGGASDFIALGSTCPHLGCQVHWEAANRRFFCPCHNGVFDAEGRGVAGPPQGMALPRFPLKIEAGLLYIEVPLPVLSA